MGYTIMHTMAYITHAQRSLSRQEMLMSTVSHEEPSSKVVHCNAEPQ